jgi:hypothetical protein
MKRIDVLPDDVLIEIFDFYMIIMKPSFEAGWPRNWPKSEIDPWQLLVHVCRRWRGLIFESPRRLKLELLCTLFSPTRDKLDIWPALPLVIGGERMKISSDIDNIIAALEQSNRVCRVCLVHLVPWQLVEVLAAMQVPFPELTFLQLFSFVDKMPVIPDSFLGGSAPRLQYFNLFGIPFPGLPKLLLSATHLVHLHLSNIPLSGYISSEAIVAPLSVMSSLKVVSIQFESPQFRPNWESRSPPPLKRSILPALEHFRFKGVIKYLEKLVTFIDTPQLKRMYITFLSRIDFDCPRLAQFINRTPKLGKHDKARVGFDYVGDVRILFGTHLDLEIFNQCREPARWLSFVAQLCDSSLPSTVEDLYMERLYPQLVSHNAAIACAIDDTVPSLWLQLLLPFTAVRNLYLSKEFAPGIAAALQELVGSRITEVLPSLRNIFVEGLKPSGPLQESIGQFVAARQLYGDSGHSIAISDWRF